MRSRMGAKEAKRLAFVVEPPTTPIKPKGGKPMMLLAAGVAFSLLIGTVLALLLGVLDKKVYAPKEVPELLGLPLLAAMPKQSAKQALRGSREENSTSAEMFGWSQKDETLEVGMRMRPLPREPDDMRDDGIGGYQDDGGYAEEMNWPQLPAHEPSSEHALALVDHNRAEPADLRPDDADRVTQQQRHAGIGQTLQGPDQLVQLAVGLPGAKFSQHSLGVVAQGERVQGGGEAGQQRRDVRSQRLDLVG